MFASLSIYGLYTFNNDVFANLAVPDGMDKDMLIAEILTECSDFCLIYPNYDFMKMLIGVWSNNEGHIWGKMWESENLEFNPLDNYDRHESISRAVTSKADGSNDTATSSNSTNSAENVGSKTAFDSDTFKDTGKERSSSAAGYNGVSNERSSSASSGTETVTTHAHGNIGVTTSAQLIQGYRDISNFCTYDFIVQSFKDRFCVQVY